MNKKQHLEEVTDRQKAWNKHRSDVSNGKLTESIHQAIKSGATIEDCRLAREKGMQ